MGKPVSKRGERVQDVLLGWQDWHYFSYIRDVVTSNRRNRYRQFLLHISMNFRAVNPTISPPLNWAFCTGGKPVQCIDCFSDCTTLDLARKRAVSLQHSDVARNYVHVHPSLHDPSVTVGASSSRDPWTLLGVPSYVIFCWMCFGKFPWLVGRFCSYLLPKQALTTRKERHNKISWIRGRSPHSVLLSDPTPYFVPFNTHEWVSRGNRGIHPFIHLYRNDASWHELGERALLCDVGTILARNDWQHILLSFHSCVLLQYLS